MKYTCHACGEVVEGDVVDLKEHTDQHVIDLIKKKYPKWVEEDGLCPRCVEYYERQIKGE